MSIKLQLPKLTDLRPRLTVVGVGGAGCNAVNNMIAAGLSGVEFVVANTDAQSLAASSAEHRIQLGANLTEGLGAGSKPEIGEAAAEEAIDEIKAQISGSHMLFVASGMGGGTGTGAAAVIARTAREQGILTVGVVTKPFQFEGSRRLRIAEAGIAELKKHVDTLIVIPNQNLFRIANEKTTFAEAFVLADQVLYSGVACIVDLIIKEGLINLDFADVRTVMSDMGTAMMGTGEASGERRAIMAAEEAISNPLLDDVSLKGAKGLLLSITGGRDLTLYEVDEAASRVRQEVDPDANIIVGATFDESLGDRVRVSIVASGMSREQVTGPSPAQVSNWSRLSGAPAAAQRPAAAPQAQHTMPTAARAPEPAQHHAPRPHAASPAPTDDDLRRRLSEAIQHAPAAMESYAPQAAAHAPHPRPGTWQAPGNVTIEEGLPMAPPPRAKTMAEPEQTGPAAAATFMPAPPAEIRRQRRRMPEIDEFPPQGQAEYRQRTTSDQSPAHVAHDDNQRRPGLFERLAGFAMRPSDSPDGAGVDHSQHSASSTDNPSRERFTAGRTQADDQGRSGGGRHRDAVDLPVFFNKGSK